MVAEGNQEAKILSRCVGWVRGGVRHSVSSISLLTLCSERDKLFTFDVAHSPLSVCVSLVVRVAVAHKRVAPEMAPERYRNDGVWCRAIAIAR